MLNRMMTYDQSVQRLQDMIDQLRRMREQCEPKSNQNLKRAGFGGGSIP